MVCFTLFAAEADLAEPLRSCLAGGTVAALGALADAARGRTNQPILGLGAGQQRGDQRACSEAAGKRDQGRFGEGVDGLAAGIGDAAPRAVVGVDGALPRRRPAAGA